MGMGMVMVMPVYHTNPAQQGVSIVNSGRHRGFGFFKSLFVQLALAVF